MAADGSGQLGVSGASLARRAHYNKVRDAAKRNLRTHLLERSIAEERMAAPPPSLEREQHCAATLSKHQQQFQPKQQRLALAQMEQLKARKQTRQHRAQVHDELQGAVRPEGFRRASLHYTTDAAYRKQVRWALALQ